MNKQAFKALRSQYRAIRADGYSMQEKIASLSAKQVEFSKSAGFNFWDVKKPCSRVGVVSINVAAKLGFPDWCFNHPKFN
jgi:hypothetical protein